MAVLRGHLMMTIRWWLFWVVCHVTHGCPVWVPNGGCTYGRRYVPAGLSWPSCHGFPVLVFLSWFSYQGSPVVIVWWLYCGGCFALGCLSWRLSWVTFLAWLSCPTSCLQGRAYGLPTNGATVDDLTGRLTTEENRALMYSGLHSETQKNGKNRAQHAQSHSACYTKAWLKPNCSPVAPCLPDLPKT